jgi:hypothetical protein
MLTCFFYLYILRVQMGLHVFFGCYFNLFRLMAKCGVLENLLIKEHTHTFCNNNGDVRELDFRFFVGGQKIGAPFHGEYPCYKHRYKHCPVQGLAAGLLVCTKHYTQVQQVCCT